jgi:hypothetical protein
MTILLAVNLQPTRVMDLLGLAVCHWRMALADPEESLGFPITAAGAAAGGQSRR